MQEYTVLNKQFDEIKINSQTAYNEKQKQVNCLMSVLQLGDFPLTILLFFCTIIL